MRATNFTETNNCFMKPILCFNLLVASILLIFVADKMTVDQKLLTAILASVCAGFIHLGGVIESEIRKLKK